jgi:hypothetical protein
MGRRSDFGKGISKAETPSGDADKQSEVHRRSDEAVGR